MKAKPKPLKFTGWHRCQHPKCKRQIPSRLLMCARHWGLVSTETKRNVYRAWNAYTGAVRLGSLYAEDMLSELRTAQAEAVREAVSHGVR